MLANPNAVEVAYRAILDANNRYSPEYKEDDSEGPSYRERHALYLAELRQILGQLASTLTEDSR